VKESTRVEPQVQPGHPGFPRAMVLRLIRALPGEAAFLAPVVREQAPAGSARVAAPGPHDFAVRGQPFRPAADLIPFGNQAVTPEIAASIASRAQRIVTIAKRPTAGGDTRIDTANRTSGK
jgi:hypothetical protein